MSTGGIAGSMRAAVYRAPRELSVEQRAVPEVGPDDALIEVSHCGVCGTDLHLVLEGMGRPGSVGGHEYSGRVVALGERTAGWEIGDAVVGGPRASCGACAPCRANRPSLCSDRGFGDPSGYEGAFADYVLVHGSQLVRVPDGLALRTAALAEPLAVALPALTVAAIQPGQRALVSGAGPLGLLAVAALRARGIDDVRVSEPAPSRLARAGAVGGTTLLEPDALDNPAMPFDLVEDAVDVVFECSGNPAAMELGLAQLVPTGSLVLVGTGMRRPKLDHNRILMNELRVTGAYCYDANGLPDAVALIASGGLPTDELIEPTDVPLDDLFGALERLESKQLARKVMIIPGGV